DKGEATADGRVLWRIDRGADHRIELYIVSPHKPCLAHLNEQAGWSTEDTWQTREYLPLLDRLRTGDRYAFRLTGNPTHRGSGPDGTKKIFGHVTAEQQLGWLADKSRAHGFLPGRGAGDAAGAGAPTGGVTVADRAERRFRRGPKTVAIRTARCDGLLEVTAPDALGYALGHGIGRAKAYGCGLLTLSPVR